MKVALISPNMDISSFGTRLLAGVLKKEGHQIKHIFLTGGMDQIRGIDNSMVLNKDLASQVIAICEDSDIIGISLMMPHFDAAVDLSRRIKASIAAPIVWGGVHPTLCPEESLNFADMVCIGEGEEPFAELLRKMASGADYYDTQNFWFNRGGTIVKNGLRPLVQKLDTIPFPDYDLACEYAYDKERKQFRILDDLLFSSYLPLYPFRGKDCLTYRTIATRGCPYSCTYCCNNIFKKLYPNENKVRRRSNENIIEELVEIKKRFPFVQAINFDDDCFLATPRENIRNFAEMYKARVGLPFYCLSSPTTIDREKLELLIDAGLGGIQMGIESGSPKITKLYGRPFSNDQVIQSAKLIHEYSDKVLPHYDIMIDCPYEDDNDLIQTLQVMLEIPKPAHFGLFSVVLFPMTELYRKALADGLVKESQGYFKDYSDYTISYLNFLFFLVGHSNIPRGIWRILLSRGAVKTFSIRILKPLYRLIIVNLHSIIARRREKRIVRTKEKLYAEAVGK